MMLTQQQNYSQFDEQTPILEWADAQPTGSFVDLGCYDGCTYSNTAALADRGWSGICIDAAPDAAAACADRYAGRLDIRVVCGVFDHVVNTGAATVHWTPGGMYSGLTPNQRKDVVIERIHVPVVHRDWLMERIEELTPPIFCSIDLEGESLAALGWIMLKTDVDCVCVEANNPDDREAVRAMMDGWWEYVMPDNHVNLIFARQT